MKVKTSELTGKALDWASGYAAVLPAVNGAVVQARDLMAIAIRNGLASRSTDWSQGGPIIDREGICLKKGHSGWWIAKLLDVNDEEHFVTVAPTPLIAAMRCYVASKLGDTVDIPEEVR